jgi:ADP-heptose:LPS heptosyltransferase
MSPLNPKKILLIKHGSLGDIVFALEPILSIHKKFNNSVIDLVTEEKFIPFFKKIKMFDQFLIDNRRGFLLSFSLIRKIINGKYDLIIDLQNSKRTNFYHFFTKIFSRSRINGSRSFVHDRYVIPVQGKESPTQGLYNQLKLLGIDKSAPDFSWLLSDEENQSIENKKIVLVIPGVSKSGHAKQWSPNKYQQLCSILESKGYYICLVGTKHDSLSFQPILNGCKNIINLIDKSPPEIIYTGCI